MSGWSQVFLIAGRRGVLVGVDDSHLQGNAPFKDSLVGAPLEGIIGKIIETNYTFALLVAM